MLEYGSAYLHHWIESFLKFTLKKLEITNGRVKDFMAKHSVGFTCGESRYSLTKLMQLPGFFFFLICSTLLPPLYRLLAFEFLFDSFVVSLRASHSNLSTVWMLFPRGIHGQCLQKVYYYLFAIAHLNSTGKEF